MNPIASRYPTPLLRSYTRLKIATDPVYDAVFNLLRDSTTPLLDVGCGIGILALYLRDRGCSAPIFGIDHDKRKIEIAQRVTKSDNTMAFRVGDARESLDFQGDVVLIDVLHYFSAIDQAEILRHAAGAGGSIIIREGIRDASLRYRTTYAQEVLSRAGGWIKAERLHFPTREDIERSLNGEFRVEVRPMFGHMPFNNYLFVFSRSSDGMTKA